MNAQNNRREDTYSLVATPFCVRYNSAEERCDIDEESVELRKQAISMSTRA
jgi:hypothetical protein